MDSNVPLLAPTSDASKSPGQFLFERNIELIDYYNRALLWVLLGTLFCSLIAVLLNVGDLKATKLSPGFVDLTVDNIAPIKLLFTFSSVVGVLLAIYLSCLIVRTGWMQEALADNKIDIAIVGASCWRHVESRHNVFLGAFKIIRVVLIVIFIFIGAILPIWTLVRF
jgi:hypothetical protein